MSKIDIVLVFFIIIDIYKYYQLNKEKEEIENKFFKLAYENQFICKKCQDGCGCYNE